MVTQMTNRLMALVMAFAMGSGLAAHAAQDPHKALPTVAIPTLPAATSLPATLQTAAERVSDTATSAVDPSGAIRSAFQRDHVALEHLRQQASALKGAAHPAFNQLISNDEATLVDLERTALASKNAAASSTIAAMDQLVSSANAALQKALAQPAAQKISPQKAAGTSHQR
jgi:hypothetical protein